MKFCKYCGKQLEDNEICACKSSQEKNSQYSIKSNEQSSEFGEKMSVAFKNIPMAFKSFWKSADNLVSIAVKEKDVLLSSIYSVIFFIATLLYNVFFVSSVQTSIDNALNNSIIGLFINIIKPIIDIDVVSFDFGKIFLTSIVMTVLIAGLYVLAEALISLTVCKKDVKSAFLNAFITFSFKSIPVSILFVLGGLLSFLSLYVSLAFMLLAVTYLIVSFCSDMFVLVGSATQNTKTMVIVNLAIVIVVGICLLVAFKLLLWCLGISLPTSAMGGVPVDIKL